MTTKQKQCLLCYLGYYDGAIDGIWGPRSVAGTKAFQQVRGLEADEAFGAETEAAILTAITEKAKEPERDFWEDIQYFRPEEFACKCDTYCDGWPAELSEQLLRLADRVRAHFGAAAIVSSGLRCPAHNANVGGAAKSRHLSGKAMDFRIVGKTAAQVLAYIQTQPEVRYAYAIDGQYVHMDVK